MERGHLGRVTSLGSGGAGCSPGAWSGARPAQSVYTDTCPRPSVLSGWRVFAVLLFSGVPRDQGQGQGPGSAPPLQLGV